MRARRRDGVIDLSRLMKPSEKERLAAAGAGSSRWSSRTSPSPTPIEDQPPIKERLSSIEVDVKSDARTTLRVRGRNGLRVDAGADLIKDKAVVASDQA